MKETKVFYWLLKRNQVRKASRIQKPFETISTPTQPLYLLLIIIRTIIFQITILPPKYTVIRKYGNVE